ncbi:hypothetical protein B0O99DRAFT_746226 [Bisporella sp. PMI_857]|nr:hypothetical protein B0O99DRAFT_746226 [Bisporella sp. PMI_857]
MYVDDQGDSNYKIQASDHVRYISIKPKVYDYSSIICFPPLLIDNLPPLSPGDWTTTTVDASIYRTFEAEWEGNKFAMAKIARFEFEIPQVERETWVYRRLSTTETMTWAPAFLGHLVENGRVMGC